MKSLLAPLASLKLTITLIILSMILIYAGTWAQIDTGIWTVQKKYFHSLFVWIDFQVLFPRPEPGAARIPGGFPMLGGYSIGLLMLINLLAAHATRFKFTWKRSGIILIHFGLILLLVGEGLTSIFAVESQMTIDEGSTTVYSQDTRAGELVVIDPSSPERDTVVSFPEAMLGMGTTLRHPLFPFEIKIDEYYANSQILGPMQAPPGVTGKATAGTGKSLVVQQLERVSGTDGGTIDVASAYVTLTSKGESLGKYLVSNFFDGPQEVVVDGKPFMIALRFQRYYKPYSMHLIKFSHDKYLGTDVPKNFSSRIQLVDPRSNIDREVLIRMNEPLRYDGETFYQASFKPDDKTTILQVVRNPAWTMPYIACAIGAMGMLIHFGMMVFAFANRPATRTANEPRAKKGKQTPVQTAGRPGVFARAFPLVVIALSIFYVISVIGQASSTSKTGDYDLTGFGSIPITFDGRVLPVDTLARTSLQIILGRQTTKAAGEPGAVADWSKVPFSEWKTVSATRWLADLISASDNADEYRIFRIDNPQLLGMLALDQDRSPRLFSFREVIARQEKLHEQMNQIQQVEPKKRDQFQSKLVQLYEHLQLYVRLSQLESLYLVPPMSAAEQWQPIGPFMPLPAAPNPLKNDAATAWLSLRELYHDHNAAEFNSQVATYRANLGVKIPADASKSEFELFFNRMEPFYQAQILYVLAFVLGCSSWLFWGRSLARAAFWLLVLSLLIHTFGLAARIYISGRPPVTNLYSSAVFIAWGGVVLAVILELIYRNAIATVSSSVMGFLSLLVAHYLAGDGDTMKQMQAVLDTNFWLATHVVAITLGYAATFFAGALAVAYVFMGVFTKRLTVAKPGSDSGETAETFLPRMVYAILCFAIFFSFVGTILGGIWADQSWGRFWGWDPKENGAVLIVLWNALILHARWAGVVKRRGVMLLAVFGNVVTSWSWFGTNMLGVGLHSYGFMESALFWLLLFMLSQIAIIVIGNIPLTAWKSFRQDSAATASLAGNSARA